MLQSEIVRNIKGFKAPVFLFFLYIAFAKNASGQEIVKGYFASPIREPIQLAGNFGELRNNHFHTGIDIKICGTEGLPIYAAADGYVSRIGVSSGGYGNALYIDHPNGYTTVYAHLHRYNNQIAAYLRQVQYTSQQFDQNLFPAADMFPVKKGDLIAFGGNSGGSRGAHLHFEVRETKSEKPVNPLLFGFDVPDATPPVIRSAKIYALSDNSRVQVVYSNGKSAFAAPGKSLKVNVVKTNTGYKLSGISAVKATGTIGFALEAVDYHDGVHNTLGPYSIEMCVNKTPHYTHNFNKLDFKLSRHMNAHIDYPEKMLSGKWYDLSYVLPNNKLPVYEKLVNNGKVEISGTAPITITYYVRDYNENTSVLSFNITPLPPVAVPEPDTTTVNDVRIQYNAPFSWSNNGFSVKMPEGNVFEDVEIPFKEKPQPARAYSPTYDFGSTKIPVNNWFDVGIAVPDLPEHLQEKACIVSSGGYLQSIFKDGYIWAQSRSLGNFTVYTDTIAPVITPVNIKPGINLWRSIGIKIRITDNLSGIKSYRGTINGNWVLFQYDAKNSLLFYQFDEYCPPGQHVLELEVTDNRNNVKNYKVNFSR